MKRTGCPATGYLAAVAAVALVALSAGTGSAADCKARMESIAKTNGDFFSDRNTTFLNNQPVLRDLRNAAIRLQAQGLEEACGNVVAAMEDAVEAYRAEDRKADADQEAAVEPEKVDPAAGGNPAGGDPAPAAAGQTATVPEKLSDRSGGTGQVDSAGLEARAVSFTNSAVLRDTSDIEGTDVYNFESERLGNARSLLLGNGQPTHLVLDHGGFWAFGQRRIAIPVEIVRWDPDWKAFLVQLTEDQLEGAPIYDGNDAVWTAQANDEYYAQLGD